VTEGQPTPWYKKPAIQNTLLILGTLIIAYYMAYFEIIRRAHAAYDRGQALYEKQEYRKALWEFEECQEFYQPPHSRWVDLSEKREWECRAYLGDWTPPEGPLDEDIRQSRAPIYSKYQAELVQIAPVPDSTYNPMPLTPAEQKAADPKGKKAKKPKEAKKP